jgi:hypothetical protein
MVTADDGSGIVNVCEPGYILVNGVCVPDDSLGTGDGGGGSGLKADMVALLGVLLYVLQHQRPQERLLLRRPRYQRLRYAHPSSLLWAVRLARV